MGATHRKASQLLIACFAIMVILCGTSRARAEFKIGNELPDFTMKKVDDGSPLSLKRTDGKVIVTVQKKDTEPKVVVLHLLQPDCLQCEAEDKALQTLHEKYAQKGVQIVGIPHRDDDKAARAYAERLKLTFPLALGTDSDFAKKFAAGDALCIADSKGVVRYSQVGYGVGDEKLWSDAIDALLAGKAVAKESPERRRLKEGDSLPVIELSSLATEKKVTLKGDGGHLAFQDDVGKTTQPRAAIGMFSRY